LALKRTAKFRPSLRDEECARFAQKLWVKTRLYAVARIRGLRTRQNADNCKFARLSHYHRLFLLSIIILGAVSFVQAQTAELRVCADPNNLPFSNRREQGFENRLARLIARDMGRKVSYVWWPQRRGFIRNTLQAKRCDVVMGIPASFELARPTRAYYRSSYVFISRRDRRLAVRSFDDPALKRLRIGLHLIGDDYANVPPAQALAKRGITRNIVGYSIYGDYSKENPPASLIDAVARGEIDVAIAWGPLAGYFARRASAPLKIVPVSPEVDQPSLQFAFDICMGVRKEDKALLDELDAVLGRRKKDIDILLRDYGAPLKRKTVSGEGRK
jgi:mxaJ protein